MELEQLQAYWTQLELEPSSLRSSQQLKKMLEGRGHQLQQDLLATLKRELMWVIGTAILVGVALGVVKAYPLLLLISVGVLLPVISIYFYHRYKLQSITTGSESVLEALKKVHHWLGQHIRRLRFMALWGMPLMGSLGILTGIGLQVGWQKMATFELQVWLVVGILMLIYGLISIIFGRWFVERQYGQHYQAIQACISELTAS